MPADSLAHGVHAEQTASTANNAKNPAQTGVTPGAGTSDAKRLPGTDAQTQRARELIYFFRTHRVFSRDEKWARTIRELATIGKPAVPELVAELDRTGRDATLRSLAFCLCLKVGQAPRGRGLGRLGRVPAVVSVGPDYSDSPYRPA